MTEWLIEALGLGERLPADARPRFEWGALPRGEEGLLLVLAALALAALTVWLYRREGAASPLRKGLLAGLRMAAFAALLLVLLEPRLAVDLEREVEGRTVVLWDTSLSMSLMDRYQDPARRAAIAAAAGLHPDDVAALSRDELARRLLERSGLFPALAEHNELVLYAFDGAPRALSLPLEAGGTEPRGPATDLTQAVRHALGEAAGRRVAAVVAVTDGRVTQGEAAQGVTELLGPRRVPFYALGVGDPTPPKNVEVSQLACEPRVLLGDPVVVDASVRARGFEGRAVEAVLTATRRDQPDAAPRELARRALTLGPDGEARRLQLRVEPEEAGAYDLELRVAPLEGEPVIADNARSAALVVSEDRLKVLLVAGSPGFEYHFLRALLTRERSTVLSCWLQSADERYPQAGNERIDELPRTIEALRAYDAVLLLDPNPEGLDGGEGLGAGFASALTAFVAEHRGGLLFVPGSKYTPALTRRPDLEPLRTLLPVVLAPGVDGGEATERWPLSATVDGEDHPVTRLSSDPDACRALWARLPGPFFSYPVLRDKAGAAVLVRHDGPGAGAPLIAVHHFQGGPVVYQGTDETWRWRSVARRAYERHWLNLLRFLVQARLAGGRKRVELLADKELYALGEPVRLRARAFDRGYRPLEASRLVARARVGADERELVLEPSPGRSAGWFEVVFTPSAQGTLELAVSLPDDDPGTPPETLTLAVRRPDLEFAEPWLDEALLEGIAVATSGALVAPGELATLAERIPSRRERLVVAGAPIQLWDRWATLLVVAGLLATEWALRKRSRMV